MGKGVEDKLHKQHCQQTSAKLPLILILLVKCLTSIQPQLDSRFFLPLIILETYLIILSFTHSSYSIDSLFREYNRCWEGGDGERLGAAILSRDEHGWNDGRGSTDNGHEGKVLFQSWGRRTIQLASRLQWERGALQ